MTPRCSGAVLLAIIVFYGTLFSQEVVSSTLNAQGQYVYERFRNRDITQLLENRSLYEIRAGLQFEF